MEVDCDPFDFVGLAAGSHNAIAISRDGRLFTWGDNNFGALGGSGGTSFPAPISAGAIPAGTRFVDAAASLWGGYGLTDDGQVYSWGLNLSGELGDGSFPGVASSSSPVAVSQGAIPSGVTAVDVVAGSGNAAILGSDGWGYTWGTGNNGINGDGTLAWRDLPVALARGAIPAGVTITQLDLGDSTGYALGSDGWVYTWGYRGEGAVGDGVTAPLAQTSPVALAPGAVPPGVTFTQISAGDSVAYALGTDGNVYAWGWGFNGQLGNGTSGNPSLTHVPVLVSAGERPPGVVFTSIDGAAGSDVVVAETSDGELYAWGQGVYGGLGNGTVVNSTTPVRVLPGSVPAGVTLSSPVVNQYATFALGSDGALYSWGGIGFPQHLGSTAVAGTTEPSFAAAFRVTEVLFDGIPGINLDTSTCPITVVTPPHTHGPVDVVVSAMLVTGTTPHGTPTQATYPSGFTYTDPPVITTPVLPDGTVGAGYASTVDATGAGPITFAVTSGALPPGLVLDPATGAVTGTPTQAGTFTVTVTATNAYGSDAQDYTIRIAAVTTPTIEPTTTTIEPTTTTIGETTTTQVDVLGPTTSTTSTTAPVGPTTSWPAWHHLPVTGGDISGVAATAAALVLAGGLAMTVGVLRRRRS